MSRIAFLIVIVLLVGCSSSGPDRMRLRGRVTYKGKPVPAGVVHFDPDTKAGNDGPQGTAEIREGKYTTKSGFGAVQGPHIVRITGFDGVVPKNDPDNFPQGRPLPFGEYRTKVDIQPGQSEYDFDIPGRRQRRRD